MNKQTGQLASQAQPDTIEAKIAPSLERRRLRAYVALLLLDAVVLHLAFALAGLAYEGIWWYQRNILAVQTMLPVYFTIALYNETYGARSLGNWVFAVKRALTALLISAALINFVAFYTKSNAEFSRVSVTLGFILSAMAIVATRRLVPVLIAKFWGGRTRNFLVIRDGGPDFKQPEAVSISASKFGLDPASHDPFMLDRLGKLLKNQDRVVISTPRERREDWAFLLKSAGVYGEIVSEPAHTLGAVGVHRYDRLDRTTLVVSTGPLGLRSRIIKRMFDVVVASAALVALSPILLFVAARIKLEDGGPILFVQRRLGQGNKFFNMLKFRSMKVGKNDADGNQSTGRDDDRITRIGHFIRRTSLDELPQIINVLRGDMSIVGPRPHALGSRANNKFFWEVDATYWARHCLKPGLTGLAQVRGHRGATEQEKDLTDRLQSDLEYVSGWSLLRDIRIVFQTFSVLQHDNAF